MAADQNRRPEAALRPFPTVADLRRRLSLVARQLPRRGPPPAHARAMSLSRRCGARTRGASPCRGPAVTGRARCRMHGGAPGSGAPRGNRNRWRHGWYSAEAIARRRATWALLAQCRTTLAQVAAVNAGEAVFLGAGIGLVLRPAPGGGPGGRGGGYANRR